MHRHQAIHQHYLIAGKFIARYTDTSWPNITSEDYLTRRSSGPKEVILYDTVTNTETHRFKSAKLLVDYLTSNGLGSKKIITSSLKKGLQRKVGNYIFKYADDETPWSIK